MTVQRRGRRWMSIVIGIVVALLALVSHAPAALAFPYHARIGAAEVYAEIPLGPELRTVLARSDALVAASPLAGGDLSRSIFLTQGGWRWHLIALTSSDTFALRRPLSAALAFNRNDVARDRIWNRRTAGGERSLSGTIAHETAHLLVARRIGEVDAVLLPTWVQEGLADYVAQESTLSDAEAARLRTTEPSAPALRYYDARRRVAAALKANGGAVDTLLNSAR